LIYADEHDREGTQRTLADLVGGGLAKNDLDAASYNCDVTHFRALVAVCVEWTISSCRCALYEATR